ADEREQPHPGVDQPGPPLHDRAPGGLLRTGGVAVTLPMLVPGPRPSCRRATSHHTVRQHVRKDTTGIAIDTYSRNVSQFGRRSAGHQGGCVMEDVTSGLAARDRLLTPGEVAQLFRVDPKTVTRWAAAGRISSIRTPGGHRRFRESEVRALLEGEGMIEPEEPRGNGNGPS